MEQLAYKYPTKQPINKKIHVGVVGSGDLEILMFPTENRIYCKLYRKRWLRRSMEQCINEILIVIQFQQIS